MDREAPSTSRMKSRNGSLRVDVGVLVVDHDTAYLASLKSKLSSLGYTVTNRQQAGDALNLILQGKEKLDIVITESRVLDMDAFMFVQQILRLKPYLPVILVMSAEDDGSMVRKGVEIGACHIYYKPIKTKELRMIWQHVFRRQRLSPEQLRNNPTPLIHAIPSQEEQAASHKRRIIYESDDSASVKKKPRMTWTREMHQKFEDAVNQIGLDNATPMKILKLMNVEGLTKEQVSSHLQKYRDKKKKLVRAAADNGGINQSDSQSGVNKNSLAPQQNTVTNQKSVVAPASTGEGNVPRILSMPTQGQGGGGRERAGLGIGYLAGHSMSYNQPLRLQDSALNPAAAALLPPVSHYPGFSTGEQNPHNNMDFFINNISFDIEPVEQNLPRNLRSSLNNDIGAEALNSISHQTFEQVEHSNYGIGPQQSFHQPQNIHRRSNMESSLIMSRSHGIGTQNTNAMNFTPQQSSSTHCQTTKPMEHNLPNNLKSSMKSLALEKESAAALGLHDTKFNGNSSAAANNIFPQVPDFDNLEPFEPLENIADESHPYDSMNFEDDNGINQWTDN